MNRNCVCGIAGLLACLAAAAQESQTPGGAPAHRLTARIRAQHYDALKALVRPGDVVFVSCSRGTGFLAQPQPGADPSDRSARDVSNPDPRRVAAAIESLGAVSDPRVEKSVVFSSVDDLAKYLRQLPRDVAWLDYNSEPGMTPRTELTSIEASVQRFAEMAHKSGRKVCWAPTNTMLRLSNDGLLALAKYVDAIALQHQKVLQYDGGATMIRLTQTRAAAIRRANPKCLVVVQVVIGRGTSEELIAAGRGIASIVDGLAVFTMRDTTAAAAVLEAVRGKGQPLAPATPPR